MRKPKLSNKIQELRKERELTQEALAEKIGLSRQSIISMEKGNCTPSLCHALKIAKFFKVPLEDIFELN